VWTALRSAMQHTLLQEGFDCSVTQRVNNKALQRDGAPRYCWLHLLASQLPQFQTGPFARSGGVSGCEGLVLGGEGGLGLGLVLPSRW